MRMSISTTSGSCSVTALRDLAAVGGLADDLDVLGAREQHRQPGADERVVVDDEHADPLAHCRPRQPGAQPEVAVLVEAVLEPAAGERGALGEADEPGPRRRGSPPRPAASTGAGLRTSIVEPFPGRSLDAAGRPAAGRRVLAGVGQRLLDDPQRVAPDGVRDGRQVGDAHVGVQAHPGGARLLEQAGQRGERRLRRLRRVGRRLRRAARRSPRAGPRAPGARWRGSPPAARATSSGGASGRNSSAPACRLSSEIRWASTSCISRAIRVRSA